MPTGVTAILVASDGAGYLRGTVEALRDSTRQPDRLVVVQLGTNPVTTTIVGSIAPTAHVHVGARLSFGRAAALGAAAVDVPQADDEWFWLLASDTAPDPDALERLVDAVEAAPSVGIAGPKLMQWDVPAYLHAFGESMTPFGTAVELAEPELDQAQYDRHSDVMAVSAGGLLIRAPLWRRLQGFDPGLPALDDALDLGVRARLAGHRVQLVPGARVRSAGVDAPGTRVLGASTPLWRRARLSRQAQLHRRLVYAPPPLLPLHWLSLLPLGLVRALGRLLRKQPSAAPAELHAAVTVALTGLPAVIRARGVLRRARTVSWRAVAPLRVEWPEIRRRRALLRDNGRSPTRREPLHFATGGGIPVLVAAAAVGIVVFFPLLGASALTGGGLLPLGDLHALWRSIGWGWRPLGEGFTGPADPFALVLAVLGSICFWNPSAALVLLWLVALPVAATGGWLLAASLTRRAPLRAVGGAVWAVAPALLAALDEGRPAPVLVHLALPFAVLAAIRARRSWTASATLALLGALLAACAPSLLPLLALAWAAEVARAAVRDRAALPRVIALPLPVLVLFAPIAAVHLARHDLIGLLADPGVVQPVATSPGLLGLPTRIGTVLQLLAGWPSWQDAAWRTLAAPLALGDGGSAAFTWALGAPLLLLAAAAVVWPRRGVSLRLVATGAAGLVAAALATRIAVSSAGATPVADWPGAALSVAWIGVAGAAVCGLDRVAAGGALPFGEPGARVAAHARIAASGVIGAAAVLAVIAAGTPLLLAVLAGTSPVRGGAATTVPALVAAEGSIRPQLGMLVLSAQPDGGVRESLVRGGGRTLEQVSTLQSSLGLGQGERLARLTAALVQPTGDDVAGLLDEFGVGYVLLRPASGGGAAAAQAESARGALGADPLLSAISTSPGGTLYRYDALPADAGDPSLTAGPSNTATPIGAILLAVQALVLGLTLLLALPTGRIATRVRPEQPLAVPQADVTALAHRIVPVPERALAERIGREREEVGAWR